MLPYAVSYNFTLCLMLLQHIYNGQPYARVDFIPPVRDLGFGLCLVYVRRFIENKGEHEILLFF